MRMRQQKLLSFVLSVLFVSSFLIMGGMLAEGKEDEQKENEIGLSVKADLPKNQKQETSGYFDLTVKPGEKQVLKVIATNTSDKEVEANVSVHTASTSMTGSIDYSQIYSKEEKNETLLYPLSEILIPKKDTVKIPPKESAVVEFDLTVPAESFNGVILGAIRIAPINNEKKKEEKDSIVINNNYAYNIAVQLSENDKKVKGELELLGVEAGQNTGRNMVLARLQNKESTIIEKLSYDGKVTKKNDSSFLHENKSEDFRAAPNSHYEYPISWSNTRFDAGEYHLSLTVKSEETGQEWQFEEDFNISREQAKKLNDSAVDLGPNYKLWLIIGIVVFVFLVLIILLITLWVKSRRNKKRRGRNKKSKNRQRNNDKSKSSSKRRKKSSKKK